MKNPAQLAYNVIVAVAVVVLFVLHFRQPSAAPAATATKPAPAAAPTSAADSAAAAAIPEPTATTTDVAVTAAPGGDSTIVRRVAYVVSGRLLEEYAGAQVARKQLEAKLTRLQRQHEAAVAAFQNAVQQYQTKAGSMLDGQRREQEEKLQQQEMQVAQQQQQLQQQAAEEEGKLNEAVLTRVNKLLEQYGKERGYDLILVAGNGSIAYGRPALDITTEVVRRLNAEYRKK